MKALAWPGVIIFGVLYLGNELKAALKRVTEIGPTGARFAPPEQQVPAPTSVPTLGSEEKVGTHVALHNLQAFIERVKSFVSDDQLQPQIRAIRAALISAAGNDPSDQVEALIYNSASLNVQLSHERI